MCIYIHVHIQAAGHRSREFLAHLAIGKGDWSEATHHSMIPREIY